jgi:HSP20 family protein
MHRDRSEGPKGREAIDEIKRRLGDSGLDQILPGISGLTEILGKVADAAERGGAETREGDFRTRDGREGRFRMGFSIRTLAGDEGESRVSVEPFGDVRRDATTGEATVSETREPPADLFDEGDHLLIVVEMPGADERETSIEVAGDVLRIAAPAPMKRYEKEILLPESFEPSAMSVSSRHGVYEIRLERKERPKP